jgi:hypothetical protein
MLSHPKIFRFSFLFFHFFFKQETLFRNNPPRSGDPPCGGKGWLGSPLPAAMA